MGDPAEGRARPSGAAGDGKAGMGSPRDHSCGAGAGAVLSRNRVPFNSTRPTRMPPIFQAVGGPGC